MLGSRHTILAPAVLATALLAMFHTDCAPILGVESEYTLAPPGQAGAGGVGATGGFGGIPQGGAAGEGGSCARAVWPDRPASTDPGPNEVDLVVAVRAIDMGELTPVDQQLVGYDLDKACTCLGDGPSCKAPDVGEEERCDGPGGRDNAVAQLVGAISAFDPELSSLGLTAKIANAEWSLLIRVSDYNGKPNDEKVVMSVYPSAGLDKDPCAPADPSPSWDGSDRWPIGSNWLESAAGGAGTGGGGGTGGGCAGLAGYDLDAPRFFDSGAYVTDGVLVASLPNAGLDLSSADGHIAIEITASTVTAKLEQVAAGWILSEGLMTGRWESPKALDTLGRLQSGGAPLCTDDAVYAFLKNAVCSVVDVTAQLAGPTAPCDAMSFGMAFEAEPAQLGVVFDSGAANTEYCPPDTDPATDSCDADGG